MGNIDKAKTALHNLIYDLKQGVEDQRKTNDRLRNKIDKLNEQLQEKQQTEQQEQRREGLHR